MIFRRSRRALARRNGAWCAFAYIALTASTAVAGHEPLVPEPKTILLRDEHPEHVVIGTRRGGYFATFDAGATWSWLCEAGVGYDDEEVYPGALLPSGKLALSTGFGGLATSRDGCDFSPWLPSEQPFVADVRVRRDARDVVVALEARADGAGFVNQLWRSSDDAESWQPLGAAFAADTQAVSFDVSEGGVLYVATASPSGADLLRSDDAGESWTRSTIAAEPGVSARLIGAYDGAEPHLYLIVDYAQADGVTTRGDRVLMSLDRGASFVPVLEGEGDLAAWSLSPDGERLAVGGHVDGLHFLGKAGSAGPDSVMTQVSSRSVHALAWDASGRLYAAGHEAIDGFSVGVSEDDGATFASFFALCQVGGPLQCAGSTTVGASCLSSGETGWDVRKEVASNDACSPSLPAGTAGAASEASETPDPTNADAPSASDDAVSDDAASCTASPRSSRASGAALLLLAWGLGAVRQTHRRRGSSPKTPKLAHSH